MTNSGRIAALHVRLDRLFGFGAFDAPPAEPQHTQSGMTAILVGALTALLVIAVMVVATTETLVAS